jgi:tRNA nucleotidyltransferase/poly(A) polymerase
VASEAIRKNLARWFEVGGLQLPSTYLVGGAVRDFLLRRPSNDLDLACRDAAGLAKRLAGRHAAALVRFEKKPGEACYRVVDRQHPDNFVDLVELFDGDILRDLNRRDFTINAMAMPIRAGGRPGALVDPHNGLSDLNGRTIRMVRPRAFTDDPLRVLRAWRFAAELGCRIDDATRAQLALHAKKLSSVAAERVVYELLRVLAAEDAAEWLCDMAELKVLDILFPEKAGRNESVSRQALWHDGLAVLKGVETTLKSARSRYGGAAGQVLEHFRDGNRLPLLKMAALFHDIDRAGKGEAERFAEGIGRRLKLSNRDSVYFTGLLAALEDVFAIAAGNSARSMLVGFFRSSANAGVGALVLGGGVLTADGGTAPAGLDRRAGVRRLSQALIDYFSSIRAILAEKDLIGGTDLIDRGMSPGPVLGKILREVRRAQDEGRVANREEALRFAMDLFAGEAARK